MRRRCFCCSKVWAFPLSLYFILGALPLPPLPPNTASFQCIYIYLLEEGGGGTVDHTSDVIAEKAEVYRSLYGRFVY